MRDEHEKVKDIIGLRAQRPLQLAPEATALIVVDVQRNFVDPEQPFMRALERMSAGVTSGYRRRVADIVLPNIARLLESFRMAGAPIAYTATGTRRDDRADLPGWLRGFDEVAGSLLGEAMWPAVEEPSWRIAPSIAPAEGDLLVNKTSAGAFATTDLERERAAGRAFTLEEAVAYALRSTAAAAERAPLTAREAEILRLLADGRSNREIAEALVLSVKTVERHLANVYFKLGVRGRVEAAAYALRRELA